MQFVTPEQISTTEVLLAVSEQAHASRTSWETTHRDTQVHLEDMTTKGGVGLPTLWRFAIMEKSFSISHLYLSQSVSNSAVIFSLIPSLRAVDLAVAVTFHPPYPSPSLPSHASKTIGEREYVNCCVDCRKPPSSLVHSASLLANVEGFD